MGSVTRNTIRASGRDTWRQRHAHDDDVFFVARMGLCNWDCCVLDCKCPQPDNHIFLQLSISTAPENVAQLRCVIDNYLTPNKDAWHQTPNIERQVADLTATTDLETEDEVCDDCGYRIFRSLEELDATHRAARAGEIHQRKCKTTGKTPRFRICEASGKLVAGRKWWRGFKKRHPQIAHRAQDPLSRERAKMSSQETVDDFFKLYTKIVAENRLQNKPNLIHNCDETGISMEVNRGRVLVPKGVKGVPCKSSGTKDRVTFHIAVTAEGKTLAPMLIYKKSFPSGAYTQSGPDNTLYAVSESGFMDKDLFEKWFCNHYVRTLPPDRPVLLLLDQCEANLSPLDKTCFGSLKDTLGSIVQGLMFENPDFQLSKRNISKVVKAAYEKSFTMTTVKKGFKSTGLYPCDKNAVSKRWVNVGQSIIDVPSTSQEDSEVNNGTHVPSCQPCRAPGCKTCGPPRTNVLDGRMVPTELSDLLVPPQLGEKREKQENQVESERPPAQKKGAQKKGKKRKREEKENEELPAASRTMLSAHPEASSSRVRKPPVWLQNYVVASDDRAPARRVLVSGRPQQFRPMGMLLKRRTSRRAGEKGRGNPQRVLRPPFL
ncbi:hypothetical protein Bbelb_406850 [Branchiostoma belcheri]|nr:hypothetical protein Bbelb_406850 [Branchiostoma belcheri]